MVYLLQDLSNGEKIMECSTVYCDVDECCTLLSSTRPLARKEHKCYECKRVINKGEKYLREVTLFDGIVETWKTCVDCESLRSNFFSRGYYFGDIIYMLREHINDSGGDVSEKCISGLTPGAQGVVCEMIEDCWEDADDDE